RANGGTLLEVDDGGLYRLVNATGASGGAPARAWDSLNGNLAITELNSLAYDPVSDLLLGGAQDVGSQEQQTGGGGVWKSLLLGDGNSQGVAVVRDAAGAVTSVVRYSVGNNLKGILRRRFDGNGKLLDQTSALLRASPASPAFSGLSEADKDFL